MFQKEQRRLTLKGPPQRNCGADKELPDAMDPWMNSMLLSPAQALILTVTNTLTLHSILQCVGPRVSSLLLPSDCT